VDGIPLGNYGTTGRDGFRVSFMGGSENKFWISLVDERGYSTATLSSNYQGLLQLRDYLNTAYEFLHQSQDSTEPLDVASCSASSIWEEIVKTRKEMKEEWDKWFVKYNALNDKLTQLEASLPKD
jgi:hypothetical protein